LDHLFIHGRKAKRSTIKKSRFFLHFQKSSLFSQPGNLRKEQKIADFKIEKSKKKNG